MSTGVATVAAVFCLALAAPPAVAQVQGPAPTGAQPPTQTQANASLLPHERYRLLNGMEVILAPEPGARMVAVDIWYHVGSGQDPVGREGLAHLAEHLMFNGSEHVPFSHAYLVHRYGGEGANAHTTLDHTAYFQTMPSFNLETALWLESDRMGFLAAAADKEELAWTRKVIRSELRLRARGQVTEAMIARLFPPTHPYGRAIGGTVESLDAITEADIEAFRARWYAPSNATLTLVGGFDPAEARRMVARYFGDLPSKLAPPAPLPERPEVQAEVHRLESADSLGPAVALGWITPGAFEEGEAELEVLAVVLQWRLDWRLAFELEIAEEVLVTHEPARGLGVFQVHAVGTPDTTSEALLAEIEDVLAQLAAAGPRSREIDGAVLRFDTAKVSSLDGLSGLMARAELLQTYNHYLRQPDRLAWDMNRYRSVTPASVKAAMARWLAPEQRATVVRDAEGCATARGGEE